MQTLKTFLENDDSFLFLEKKLVLMRLFHIKAAMAEQLIEWLDGNISIFDIDDVDLRNRVWVMTVQYHKLDIPNLEELAGRIIWTIARDTIKDIMKDRYGIK